MSVREDLETVATLLETMLSVRMADEPSVNTCLRLIKRACSELEAANGEDAAPEAGKDLGPGWLDDDSKKPKPAPSSMDQQMGVTALHTGGTSYENGIQTLGVQHVVSK